ncbi:MAG: preprotein translocase subunit YajC [Deltaproteobacteria bacterium]|nr:preprotein translocase subunit YajC [Deltaproteobacteria bacterium]
MRLIYSLFFYLAISDNLWAQEAKKAPAQAGPADLLKTFFPIILVFAIFYLLIIRPQQKQAKQRQEMIKAVSKNERVVTVGGIHGKVVGITDDVLTLEIADNCKIKIERSGIQTVKKES